MTKQKTFGHYQVKAEIGRGGMAVVYKCWEPNLSRFVAVKVLAEHLVHNKELKERFLREAKSMAAINHPNVIQIHFISEEHGQPYFAMEYIKGQSLAEILQNNMMLSVKHATNLLYQACDGLLAAHNKGLIHRDIKPGNLMISDQGTLKLVDFGIAQSQEFEKRLTSTGELVGTPGYLAPEVCIGQPIDIRADIFSLGIVFYEMLAGRIPFDNDSPLGLLLDVVESNVTDIREINNKVDNKTGKFLQKMIARNPDERFQNCQEIINLLNIPTTNNSVNSIIDARTQSTYKHSKPVSNSNITLTNNLVKPKLTRNVNALFKPKLFLLTLVLLFSVLVVRLFLDNPEKTSTPIKANENTSNNNQVASEKEVNDFFSNFVNNEEVSIQEGLEFTDTEKIDDESLSLAQNVGSKDKTKIRSKQVVVSNNNHYRTASASTTPTAKFYRCVEVSAFTMKKKKTSPEAKSKAIQAKFLHTLRHKTIKEISQDNNSLTAYASGKNKCPNNKRSLLLRVEVELHKVTKYLTNLGPEKGTIYITLTLINKKTKMRLAQKRITEKNIAQQLAKNNSHVLDFTKKITKFIRSAIAI